MSRKAEAEASPAEPGVSLVLDAGACLSCGQDLPCKREESGLLRDYIQRLMPSLMASLVCFFFFGTGEREDPELCLCRRRGVGSTRCLCPGELPKLLPPG